MKLSLAVACNTSDRRSPGRGSLPETFAPLAQVSAPKPRVEERPTPRATPTPAAPKPSASAADFTAIVSDQGEVTVDLIIDALVDVGPAGPATASAHGVVMVDRNDRVAVAHLGPLPRGASPAASPLSALPLGFGPFPLARGPGVLGEHAYWVSKHELLRSKLGLDRGGPAEVLRQDARNGTRVAVAAASPHERKPALTLVGYIATGPPTPAASVPSEPAAADAFSTGFENSEKLVARLWRPEGPTLDLTPAASSTSSLTLAAFDKGWVTLALEGRTGMSIVHAWTLGADGPRLEVSDGGVVWVGGGTQPLTEILSLADESRVFAITTLERDITHFGLVALALERTKFGVFGQAPPPDARAEWYTYPNGIDPAPAFGAVVCGAPLVALAQPSSKEPNVPQELRLVALDAGTPPRILPMVLARSRAFFDVSLAALPGGALLVYSADRRTWARTLRCRRHDK